ncbi:30S ribosomal protein S3 [Candidatus Woesearchaeota archaeon]|nr:30S ribosomal protein S3 [Candidatus Woesearchaeota archaeon]
MIERKFVAQNIKELQVKEFVASQISRAGLSEVKLQRTPLGEKIIVSASRPGIVVGRAGANIAKLTADLKKKFNLENPQIEINEVQDHTNDASIVAEMIANSLERFGPSRFKAIGHKAMLSVMSGGAKGVEILLSGKIPSSRAKTWRFYMGYLKKCGDIAVSGVKKAYAIARLKTGVVGIQVSIMPSDIVLPDKVSLLVQPQTVVEEVKVDAKMSEKPESSEKESKEKNHADSFYEGSADDKQARKESKLKKEIKQKAVKAMKPGSGSESKKCMGAEEEKSASTQEATKDQDNKDLKNDEVVQ